MRPCKYCKKIKYIHVSVCYQCQYKKAIENIAEKENLYMTDDHKILQRCACGHGFLSNGNATMCKWCCPEKKDTEYHCSRYSVCMKI